MHVAAALRRLQAGVVEQRPQLDILGVAQLWNGHRLASQILDGRDVRSSARYQHRPAGRGAGYDDDGSLGLDVSINGRAWADVAHIEGAGKHCIDLVGTSGENG